MSRGKFYADLLERVVWTFIQAAGAEWLLTMSLDEQTFKLAGLAGGIAVLKCLLATQVGASNTAATLAVDTDTEKG